MFCSVSTDEMQRNTMLWLNQSSPEEKTAMGIQEYYHFIQTIKLFCFTTKPLLPSRMSQQNRRSVIASLFEPGSVGFIRILVLPTWMKRFGFQLFILHFLLPTLIVKLGAWKGLGILELLVAQILGVHYRAWVISATDNYNGQQSLGFLIRK